MWFLFRDFKNHIKKLAVLRYISLCLYFLCEKKKDDQDSRGLSVKCGIWKLGSPFVQGVSVGTAKSISNQQLKLLRVMRSSVLLNEDQKSLRGMNVVSTLI